MNEEKLIFVSMAIFCKLQCHFMMRWMSTCRLYLHRIIFIVIDAFTSYKLAHFYNCEDAGWAEALLKIARMTLTIKLDGNWSSF
ncbi:MAG: hypothetical protein EBZ36_18740, partial [Acidobacteria bacterium]|nr:hypothetical protein [Acidobacteriota bacterium]